MSAISSFGGVAEPTGRALFCPLRREVGAARRWRRGATVVRRVAARPTASRPSASAPDGMPRTASSMAPRAWRGGSARASMASAASEPNRLAGHRRQRNGQVGIGLGHPQMSSTGGGYPGRNRGLLDQSVARRWPALARRRCCPDRAGIGCASRRGRMVHDVSISALGTAEISSGATSVTTTMAAAATVPRISYGSGGPVLVHVTLGPQ